jgi:hypothetical protein
MDYLSFGISTISAILLAAIVTALIVSRPFRTDILNKTGEAKLGGNYNCD